MINPLTETHPLTEFSVRRTNGFTKGIIIMMNESGKCEKHIKGINCAVKNCVYHDGDSYCTAENIHVGPNHAEKSADTVCATFKCEGNC